VAGEARPIARQPHATLHPTSEPPPTASEGASDRKTLAEEPSGAVTFTAARRRTALTAERATPTAIRRQVGCAVSVSMPPDTSTIIGRNCTPASKHRPSTTFPFCSASPWLLAEGSAGPSLLTAARQRQWTHHSKVEVKPVGKVCSCYLRRHLRPELHAHKHSNGPQSVHGVRVRRQALGQEFLLLPHWPQAATPEQNKRRIPARVVLDILVSTTRAAPSVDSLAVVVYSAEGA
jgi:hypothetical protein